MKFLERYIQIKNGKDVLCVLPLTLGSETINEAMVAEEEELKKQYDEANKKPPLKITEAALEEQKVKLKTVDTTVEKLQRAVDAAKAAEAAYLLEMKICNDPKKAAARVCKRLSVLREETAEAEAKLTKAKLAQVRSSLYIYCCCSCRCQFLDAVLVCCCCFCCCAVMMLCFAVRNPHPLFSHAGEERS